MKIILKELITAYLDPPYIYWTAMSSKRPMKSRGMVPLKESNICSQYWPDLWQKSKPSRKLATERIAEKQHREMQRLEMKRPRRTVSGFSYVQFKLMKEQYYNLKKYIANTMEPRFTVTSLLRRFSVPVKRHTFSHKKAPLIRPTATFWNLNLYNRL